MKDFELIYKAANESIRPSADFKQRTLDRIFEDEQKKPRSGKKLMLLLVAAIIAISAFVGTVSAIEYYQEVVEKAKYEREEKMSLSERYSSMTDFYSLKVESVCEAEGLKITLTEAIYENDTLTVTFVGEYNGKVHGIMLGGEMHNMYINGESNPEGWIGSVEQNGDHFWTTMDYSIGYLEYSGLCEITVQYPWAAVLEDGMFIKEINHPWEFTFTIDLGMMETETVIYSIGQEYMMEDGRGIYFDSIVCTPVSQVLMYKLIDPYRTEENPENSYFPSVRAVDPSRTYEFVTDSGIGDTAKAFNIHPDKFDMNVKKIVLTVYISNGLDFRDSMKITCTRQDGE